MPPSGSAGSSGGGGHRWLLLVGLAALVGLLGGLGVILASGMLDDSDDEVDVVGQTGDDDADDAEAVTETDGGGNDGQGAAHSGDAGSAGSESAQSDGSESDGSVAADGDTCTYLGVDSFDDMQTELAFQNPHGDVEALQVTYSVVDGEGARIATATEWVTAASAGERFRFEADTFEELPGHVTDDSVVTCSIVSIEPSTSFGDAVAPGADDECSYLGVDAFDDIQVQLSVKSPFDSVADIQVEYVLRDGDGVRFGDGFEWIEAVGAGEQIRQESDSVTDVPSWVDESEITCEILGLSDLS